MNWSNRIIIAGGALLAAAAGAWAEMVTLRVGTPPASALAAKAAAAPIKVPEVYVAKAAGEITIDGKLDEEAWRAATRIAMDRTLDGAGAASQPTSVWLLRGDDGMLYVGVRCGEPKMDQVRAGKPGRDVAVWQDDSVEIFIGPAGGAYYRFGANVAGAANDGRGKDDSWNAPFKVATTREKDHWIAEFALPLAKMSGEKVPTEWRANFNRTRYAGTDGEEFAWSPTFSGDSHSPDRFGKLFLTDPPAKPVGEPVKKGLPVEVAPAEGGVATLKVDLSALPPGAKVHHAELRLFRRSGGGGADDLLKSVEVSVSGKALSLCGLRLDRLHATEAVRTWSEKRAEDGRIAFFIKTAPPLDLSGTCLDVAYESKGKDLPKQAAGLKAVHRSGQTFITFDDREDAFGDKPVTWGQIRDYFSETDPKRQVRYRVYRHDKPIDAAAVAEATLLAEVEPLSAFNVNGWSIERLVNQVVFGNEDQGELGDYGPFSGWNRNSPQGGKLVIPRLAIEDAKTLPPGNGLYVHSVNSPRRKAGVGGETDNPTLPAGQVPRGAIEKAYYAVTVSVAGVENLSEFSPGNSLAKPIDEAPGEWQPVVQPAGMQFGFDYRGERIYYVQWVDAPLAPQPTYFNWSVLVPPDARSKLPVELYFHGPGESYARPPVKFLDRSIQICPHDFPPSGWYGCNDATGTLKSPAEGVVRPYTIRRIESFLKWAEGKYPVDTQRVIPVGGDGAGLMALYRPGLFAYVIGAGFDSRQLDPKAAGEFVAAWGPQSERIKSEEGLTDWKWGELDVILAGKRLPNLKTDGPAPEVPPDAPGFATELPLFITAGYTWGSDPGYVRGRGRFLYALQGTRHPFHGRWGWNSPILPEKFSGRWQGLDITVATPIVAITNNSRDGEGESRGNANGYVAWKDLKDTPEAFEVTIVSDGMTFDLTPRRCRQFKARPGEKCTWTNTSLADAKEIQTGSAVADKYGLVTATKVIITKGKNRLVIQRAK